MVDAQIYAKVNNSNGARKKQRRYSELELSHVDENELYSMGDEDKGYMQAHGVWEAVVPKDPKAVVEEKIDKLAMAAIYQSIPEDVLLSFADKETAKTAWEAIKVMSQCAERVKSAKVQILKAEFEAMKMKDTDSLDDFCLKITALVTNIRALGEVVVESYVVKKLL